MRSLGPFCLALFSPEKRCDADTLNILVSTLYANETFQSRRAESSLSLSLSLSPPSESYAATLLERKDYVRGRGGVGEKKETAIFYCDILTF